MKIEEQLVTAVRNSLNLPDLKVSARPSKLQRTWRFRLHHAGASSDWIELDEDSIRVMKQIGLLPALHLGVFRIAYAALRRAAENKPARITPECS